MLERLLERWKTMLILRYLVKKCLFSWSHDALCASICSKLSALAKSDISALSILFLLPHPPFLQTNLVGRSLHHNLDFASVVSFRLRICIGPHADWLDCSTLTPQTLTRAPLLFNTGMFECMFVLLHLLASDPSTLTPSTSTSTSLAFDAAIVNLGISIVDCIWCINHLGLQPQIPTMNCSYSIQWSSPTPRIYVVCS